MESSKLYVGNINYSVTDDQLKELFSTYGTVKSVKIIEGKGFGFVEMTTSQEAEEALESLNNNDYEGRPLKISEARERIKR